MLFEALWAAIVKTKQGMYSKIAIETSPNSFSNFNTKTEILSCSELYISYKLYHYVLTLLDIL